MAVPKSGAEEVEMIRMLKVAKDSAIECRTKAINQIRALLVTAPSVLREHLAGLSRSELIKACAAFRPGELVGPLAAAKRSLRSLARRIQALDQELAELLADLDALTQAACPGLRQTYGIGVDGAAILLTAAGDNPERLRSEAAFAALCGASPLPASAGNSRRHRLNRGGNRQANAALHRIAVVRLRYHQPSRDYAERRKAEGLSNREILRCLKRFIAREVFHLLRGRPPLRTAAA
jgi:transposase